MPRIIQIEHWGKPHVIKPIVMVQCDQIWRNFPTLANFLVFGKKLRVKLALGIFFMLPILAIYLCFWANFNRFKWPNIKKTSVRLVTLVMEVVCANRQIKKSPLSRFQLNLMVKNFVNCNDVLIQFVVCCTVLFTIANVEKSSQAETEIMQITKRFKHMTVSVSCHQSNHSMHFADVSPFLALICLIFCYGWRHN